MTFRVVRQPSANRTRCPYRVIEQGSGREIGWISQYLDYQTLRRLADRTLENYAYALLHFLRWWESVHHTDAIAKEALTESILLDYVRFQSSQQREVTGGTINQRVATVDHALRIVFPDAPGQIAPGFQQTYWQRAPMGIGRPRLALSRLRVKTPKRTISPLSVDEVARFWSSFRTSRDLAIVGLMLLQGLRSQEVMDLNRDDLLLPETQGFVHEVVICAASEVIARHPRSYEREDMIFDPLHYLALLERKPNALDQAAPLAGWDLPEGFTQLRRLLEARLGKKGKREYVQVLRLLETFARPEVTRAIEDALRLGAISFDAVKHLLLCRIEQRPARLDLENYPHLPAARVATTAAADYLTLLSQGSY